ncbi:MAG: hypothetical protein BWY51_00471 [Parcubacteria group bacterium ADurb.Bin316]|nr:MAG: hypothetical protein BWY51_00471 [Parcubacteria group bacterium ADurb.Bin316]
MADGLSLAGAGRNVLKGRYPNDVQRGIIAKLVSACPDIKCPGTVPFDSLLAIKALDRLRDGQRRNVLISELRDLVSKGKARQKGAAVGLTTVEAAALFKTSLGSTSGNGGGQ